MTAEYNLDADLFMRVRRAVGTEETRYYLTGVYVEPHPDGGALMVGTEGRAMLVAHDPDGVAPAPTIVKLTLPEEPARDRADCCDEYCALTPVSYSAVRLNFALPQKGPGIAHFLRKDDSWRHAIVERIDGRFPDWRKVFDSPKKIEPRKGHQAYGINPALLDRVTGGDVVTLRPTPSGASQIVFEGSDAITGLIMPCDLKRIDTSAALADALSGKAEAVQ